MSCADSVRVIVIVFIVLQSLMVTWIISKTSNKKSVGLLKKRLLFAIIGFGVLFAGLLPLFYEVSFVACG